MKSSCRSYCTKFEKKKKIQNHRNSTKMIKKVETITTDKEKRKLILASTVVEVALITNWTKHHVQKH